MQEIKHDTDRPLMVGGVKRPDGSWDFSKSLVMEDPDGKISERIDQLHGKVAEKKRVAHEWSLKIPEEVKAGTAHMVDYTLRNALFINKEVVDKAQGEGKTDQFRMSLIATQKMQQAMLDDAFMTFRSNLIKDALTSDQIVTAEQTREAARNLSAGDMCNLIDEVIQSYGDLQAKKVENAGVMGLQGSYPIKDLLKAAKGLQSMLMDESSRGSKN